MPLVKGKILSDVIKLRFGLNQVDSTGRMFLGHL